MNNLFLYMFGSASATSLVVSPHTSNNPAITLVSASILVAGAFALAHFIAKKVL